MRTFNEILSALRADVVANTELQTKLVLDATKTFDEQFSKVSFLSILTYIVASAIFLHEQIVNDKAVEIEAQIASKYPFSIPWYYAQSLAFQLGDELVFNKNTFQFAYASIDATKQIIKYTSIRQRQVEGVTKLQVFATKENKVALTADELTAYSAYLRQVGAAGTHFQFISLAPDNLELNLTVYYNPQILKADGTSYADGSKPVETAIDNYLNGITYGGVFNRTKLTDAVQLATGVSDAVLFNVKLNGDLNNTREFESASGFYNSLNPNIEYIAV